MKLQRAFALLFPRILVVALLSLAFAGCTTQKVNWAARVGNYTFDQAVMELGPPDKQAKLEDGVVVAEWLTRRGYPTSYFAPAYYPYPAGAYYGPVFPAYVDTYSPDYFLRLTFDSGGRLSGWKKFAR